MSQKWSDLHLGKRSNAGIDNESRRTGFADPAGSTIPFGYAVAPKTGVEGAVMVAGESGAADQILGFAAFSQEATIYSEHSGPGVRYAAYPTAYAKGDVVSIIDRGSVIVKVSASSSGIQAGDAIVVMKDGTIDALKNITEASGGSNKCYAINAIAESDASAEDCIGIQIYSPVATVVKYN